MLPEYYITRVLVYPRLCPVQGLFYASFTEKPYMWPLSAPDILYLPARRASANRHPKWVPAAKHD